MLVEIYLTSWCTNPPASPPDGSNQVFNYGQISTILNKYISNSKIESPPNYNHHIDIYEIKGNIYRKFHKFLLSLWTRIDSIRDLEIFINDSIYYSRSLRGPQRICAKFAIKRIVYECNIRILNVGNEYRLT